MSDGQGVGADIDQVKGVLVSFPADPTAGCASAALDDNDAPITMVAGEKIQRVADIRPVQVSSKNHFDLVIHKAIDGAPAFLHGDIEHSVVPRRKVMMRHDDANLVFGHPL